MTYEPTEADVMAAMSHDPYEATGGMIDCICGWPDAADFKAHEKRWEPDYNDHLLRMVVPGIIARELWAAALYIGHHETCRPDPDRDPYIGCECRVSLLYGRADRIEAGEQP